MVAGVLRAQDAAAGFNAAYPVGTLVRYWSRHQCDCSGPHEGEGVTLRPAQRMGGVAVVHVDGAQEMVLLSLVEAVAS